MRGKAGQNGANSPHFRPVLAGFTESTEGAKSGSLWDPIRIPFWSAKEAKNGRKADPFGILFGSP